MALVPVTSKVRNLSERKTAASNTSMKTLFTLLSQLSSKCTRTTLCGVRNNAVLHEKNHINLRSVVTRPIALSPQNVSGVTVFYHASETIIAEIKVQMVTDTRNRVTSLKTLRNTNCNNNLYSQCRDKYSTKT